MRSVPRLSNWNCRNSLGCLSESRAPSLLFPCAQSERGISDNNLEQDQPALRLSIHTIERTAMLRTRRLRCCAGVQRPARTCLGRATSIFVGPLGSLRFEPATREPIPWGLEYPTRFRVPSETTEQPCSLVFVKGNTARDGGGTRSMPLAGPSPEIDARTK